MQAEISSFFMYSLSAIRLVHYDPGQEYTGHHDYGFSDLGELQGARFATLLLYLNDDGLEGGETTFPRYVNAETFDKLKVTPEEGKAVLPSAELQSCFHGMKCCSTAMSFALRSERNLFASSTCLATFLTFGLNTNALFPKDISGYWENWRNWRMRE